MVNLDVETVTLPNGATVDLEIIRHPGAVAVVPLKDDGTVLLIRQYRHAAGGYMYEVPAGKLDPGEAPRTTAERELVEEAGVRAATWQALGRTISSPGIFTEVIHLYLAQDLTLVPAAAEEHEVFEVHWLPWGEAMRMATEGEIEDAKTLAGLMRAQAVLGAGGVV